MFGEIPPSEKQVIEQFLRDKRFLLLSFNLYNDLRVGTTQLYNESVVYNHKRQGVFKFGNKKYKFVIKHHFPYTLSKEFLFVDLVNNIKRLAEDPNAVLALVKIKARELNKGKLQNNISEYGNIFTKNFFREFLVL